MKIKDIVNREIVNLTNCEQEPIHIPGSIQPNGFLLGLKPESFDIDFCSGNSAEFIGVSYTQILGKSFDQVFGEEALKSLLNYISENRMLSSLLLNLKLFDKYFTCTVHLSKDMFILEAEPINPESKNANEVYDHTSKFLAYMHTTRTLQDLCELVAKGTREITGYDRVMIYRFDSQYNGEVFAESKREDLEPFLGLHYPHTDIPSQARDLYMKNLLRIITDIDYSPIPIYTIDDRENKTLDLSLAILRSTSPIHVQYLHNMGVGATLTISLIHKNKLWGLIACHHYSPKNLTPEIRLAAQLQGHFITSQIEVRQSNEQFEVSKKVNTAFDKLNSFNLTGEPKSFEELVNQPDILEICNAKGVSILFEGKIYKKGITPSTKEIKFISKFFAKRLTTVSHFHTNKLFDLLPDQRTLCENTAGVIYHSLDITKQNCIIWYRPETKSQVNWAGDPSKSIILDKKGLSPRNSFKLWKEIVDCTSRPWLEPELETTSAFVSGLQRQIILVKTAKEEQKYRQLSEMLKVANAELENMNWISSHDLQEPLRKIQLITSHLMTEDEIPDSVQYSLQRLNLSAEKMRTLLEGIMKYNRVKYTDEAVELVNLNELVSGLADQIIKESEVPVKITVKDLPTVKGVPFFLKQLFSNILENAIKYRKADKDPKIKISAKKTKQIFPLLDDSLFHEITVSDNGIGFEEKHFESIFNIFTRLHLPSEYSGSGMGLALCKKIVKKHNGHITASSEPGKGTVISIYLPPSS